VVDASATVAMLLEETEQVVSHDSFDILTEKELIVPSHWPAEVGNALLVNVRRGRLSPDRLSAIVERLNIFRFQVQQPPQPDEIVDRLQGALTNGLTYYDALYVQLAVEQRATLFSLDRQMRRVAKAIGINVLPDM
jgi:predicted nucleic acid-binding protein